MIVKMRRTRARPCVPCVQSNSTEQTHSVQQPRSVQRFPAKCYDDASVVRMCERTELCKVRLRKCDDSGDLCPV
eukprot:COSAG02_NODE_3083_length_7406_cov_3.325578_1_plen_73_part_10